jgi:hypothetical protein
MTFLLFSSSYSEWIEIVEYSDQMSEFYVFFASLLWLTVLTFDAWWSIRYNFEFSSQLCPDQSFCRNFETPASTGRFFKFYCIYSFGFPATFLALMYFESPFMFYSFKQNVLFHTELCLNMVAFADAILVVLTIRMINELKRQENYTESPQFSKEVER